MTEPRTAETVRREIEVERRELARALDRLRTETVDVKRQVRRRVRSLVALILLAAGLFAAVRTAVKRRFR